MSAQTVTPVLLGLLFTRTGAWKVLPVYASILLVLSFVVFTIFLYLCITFLYRPTHRLIKKTFNKKNMNEESYQQQPLILVNTTKHD